MDGAGPAETEMDPAHPVVAMAMDGEADSPINLPETMSEARESIGTRLGSRPTQQELVARNIMPGGWSHPALHAASRALGRAKVGDALSRKFQTRPTKNEIVQRNIMRDTQASPLVVERQHEIEQRLMRQHLEAKIENRPGPLDLVSSSILEPPGSLELTLVKREWPELEPAVKMEPDGVPLPPPLPELSPSRRNSESEPFAYELGPEARGALSPSASRQPSLYSISSPDAKWPDAKDDGGSAEAGLAFDFTVPPGGMELEWPGEHIPLEHPHIVQEQLKNQAHQVSPFAATTRFLPSLGPVLEDLDDVAWSKVELHQQLTDVQSRATLPMRGIRPRVQEYHRDTAVGHDVPTSAAASTSPEKRPSEMAGLWASQLAHLESRKSTDDGQQVGGGARGSQATKKKKKSKIKKFTYHNYKGPDGATASKAKKRRPRASGSCVTPPSPNRQILLHQQQQFLRLEEIAGHRSTDKSAPSVMVHDDEAAAAAAAAGPRSETSRTPPDLDVYGSHATSLSFDRLNPERHYTLGEQRATSNLELNVSTDETARGMVGFGSMPHISVDLDAESATPSVVRRPSSASRHQRAGSWGGRLEPPLDLSAHRASTPLLGSQFSASDIDGPRTFDSGFGNTDFPDLGMFSPLGGAHRRDAQMEDMGIGATDFDMP